MNSDNIPFPERELGQKKYDDMSVTLSWVARFATGNLHTSDKQCSGRTTQVTIL
jgi:hypothetical protein